MYDLIYEMIKKEEKNKIIDYLDRKISMWSPGISAEHNYKYIFGGREIYAIVKELEDVKHFILNKYDA